MKIADLNMQQTCCGEHTFQAEHIREDGVGFLISQAPESGLYLIKVFEPDRRTLRAAHSDLTETQADELLAA